MTETVAVLFIFFVLILFGIIFYYKYAEGAIAQEKQELIGKRAIATSLKVLFAPELICSNGGAEVEDNCIDMGKLPDAIRVIEENPVYYFNIFSYATISIEQIYPGGEESAEIILYDRPRPDWENQEAAFFVVALRDKIFGDNVDFFSFGYLKVVAYQ